MKNWLRKLLMIATNQTLPTNLAQRLIYLQDPVNFLTHCVFTQDEVDALQPLKPAPMHLAYIPSIARIWQQNDLVIVDKCRRMWISWLMLSLHLQLAFTKTYRRIGIVSKKFEDSCAHLRNMEFIYKEIPDSVYPKACRPQMRIKEGFIFFDEIHSTIHALAMGPDQARQYGFSALFFDEMDFWPGQEATFSAAKPTLQGGGKLTIATTHCMQETGEESFYRRLLEDRL